MVTHQTNRTFICSTVFVDLVEYSRKSVSEQLALKDRFTALLADALEGIDINERIILDTGDGAAMSFLGDPEQALAVGMSLRRAFRTAAETDPASTAPIRIGINLGPVKLVKDINGHPNIVGDGINVAQRIMSFADSGQILVSRSFHDVVACLSEDYAALFKFEGSRTDKHVRDHEVYAVADSDAVLDRAKAGGAATPRATPADTGKHRAAAAGLGNQTGAHAAATAFLHDKRKVAIAGGVLALLIAVLGTLLLVRKPVPGKPADPVALESQAVAASPAQPAPPAPKNAPAAAASKPAALAVAQEKTGAPKAAAAKAAEPTAATGTVTLAVQPWGEVFVNGRSRGVSPPLKNLKLAPGTYTIEVRNTTFPPGKQKLQVKAREEVAFRHVFK
jgi:class 3 adenylate cyclase